MPQSSQVHTPDGISWYIQQSGTGPHLLLIPSGEGDCTVYDKLASLLSAYTVTTFDMPCFSRTIAPISCVQDLTPYQVADQIVLLMDELKIQKASIFGISSGGNLALALLDKYDSRVEKIVVHEVPMTVIKGVVEFTDRPESEDEKTIAHFEYVFAKHMNKDKAAWLALGPEYHQRSKKNYVRWIKHYAGVVSGSRFGDWKEGLTAKKERVFWSVGGLMPMFWFFDNVVFCTEVGIRLEMLDCKHFPQVSIREVLAEYIKKCLGISQEREKGE